MSTVQTQPQHLLVPCPWCKQPEASGRLSCREEPGKKLGGSFPLNDKTEPSEASDLALHGNRCIFGPNGRNVLAGEEVSIHVVDACQVVNVSRIVEQPTGFRGDEVAINHRGKMKEGHTGIWNQSIKKNSLASLEDKGRRWTQAHILTHSCKSCTGYVYVAAKGKERLTVWGALLDTGCSHGEIGSICRFQTLHHLLASGAAHIRCHLGTPTVQASTGRRTFISRPETKPRAQRNHAWPWVYYLVGTRKYRVAMNGWSLLNMLINKRSSAQILTGFLLM